MLSTLVRSETTAHPNPASPRLSIEGARTVIWLDGEHDIANVHVIATALAEAIAHDELDVLVDLTEVSFTVRSPSSTATRMLDICGLGGLVDVDLLPA